MTSKRKNREERRNEWSTLRTIGTVLEVLVVPILIIAHVLRTMEDKNLPLAGLVLGIATCLLIAGLIMSHLPRNEK